MIVEKDINSLIKLVGNVFDAFTAALFLVDQSRTRLVLNAYYSLSRNIVRNKTIEFGHGLVGWVAQHKENLNVSKFKHDTTTLQFYSKDEEIKSFLAVPVFLSELEGVLCVDSKKSYVFTPKMQKILIGFAEQFSHLIYNARIQELKEKSVTEISSIYDFCKRVSSQGKIGEIIGSLSDISAEMVYYDGLLLTLLDDNNKECEVIKSSGFDSDLQGLIISPQHSLIGWVVRNGSCLNISNLTHELKKTYVCSPHEPNLNVKSFLGIPLQTGDKILGALCLTRNKRESFNNYDMQIASIIGYHGAVALSHAKLSKRWESLEFIDSLTGLYNVRYFHENVNTVLSQSPKSSHKHALLMIELNHLDRIKERYGYRIRDGVLRQTADILKSFLSKKDLAIRYDERSFVLFIREVNLDTAKSLAGKLKEVVEQTVFFSGDKEINTKLSIGISMFPFDGTTGEELIEKSTAALIKAKQSGMNQVCEYTKAKKNTISR